MGIDNYVYIGPYLDMSNFDQQYEYIVSMKCNKCDIILSTEASFCHRCGAPSTPVHKTAIRSFQLGDVDEDLYDDLYMPEYTNVIISNRAAWGIKHIEDFSSAHEITDLNIGINEFTEMVQPIFDWLKSKGKEPPKIKFGVVAYSS